MNNLVTADIGGCAGSLSKNDMGWKVSSIDYDALQVVAEPIICSKQVSVTAQYPLLPYIEELKLN